jgi:two-component system OmpR family sensor kinase
LVLASILIGFVSVFALRSFLTDRLDAQLAYALERSQAAVVPPMNNQNNPGNNNGNGNGNDNGGNGTNDANNNGNNTNNGNTGRDNNGNGNENNNGRNDNGRDNNGNNDGRDNNDANRENTRGVLRAPGQSAGMLVAVVSESGAITAGILDRRGNPEIVPDGTLVTEDVLEAQQAGNRPFTLEPVGEGTFRAVSAATGTQRLIIGLPLEEVDAATTRLIVIILIVTIGGVGAAIVAGRLLVRWELRPLERVANTATRVSQLPLASGSGTITERIATEDTDPRTEVGQVGAAMNAMLGHVDRSLSARRESEEKVRRFVADASHELRTPLASIRGYAELTRRTGQKMPEQVRHSLDRIESEAERMTGLVEDLLLLARLDEGRELQHDRVDLSRIIIDAVSDANAAGPDHDWRMSMPDDPVMILGDAPRVHQVVANLLANARVHTPAGTVVTVGIAPRGDSVDLTVSDNGPGIPRKDLATLFERFTRGDASRARATGTTGLGLAIVNAVVTAHGGTVSVESRKGKTVFTVSLPAA